MENSNNITGSPLQFNDVSSMTSNDGLSTSNSSWGIWDSIKNVNATTWFIIIIILAFLGFNIFVYLAKGTQDIANFFGPIIAKVVGLFAVVTGETIDVAAEGTKKIVNTTADVVDTGLTAIENVTPNLQNSSIKGEQVPDVSNQPINNANNNFNQGLNVPQQPINDYEANEASSSLNAGGQAGWCYIGEDRGFRTCSQVGVNDKCMSGDIFPSHEICINPSLRA
jgi:hypothetical protein